MDTFVDNQSNSHSEVYLKHVYKYLSEYLLYHGHIL